MKEIKFVGWFSDLPHGRPDSPSISECKAKLASGSAGHLATYLDGGTVVAETTGAILRDEIDPAHPDIGPFRTLTDGEYVWPSDLSFYVRRYRVDPGSDIAEKASNGPSHPLSDAEIDNVVDQMLS
jgi:hypothetical protein